MKTLTILFCICALSLTAVRGEDSTTLTFDDLSPGTDHFPVTNGFGGLQWDNFEVINGLILPVNTGYFVGTVSPSNVVYNSFGNAASFGSSNAFNLNSAYLTAAFLDGLEVRVQGYAGATVIYDNTYTLNSTNPTLINFSYAGVDRVTFTNSSISQFVIDNLVIGEPATDNDGDSDSDGVPDSEDQCPDTAPGALVNEQGCSVDQLVPCDGPVSGGTWKNHGQYVAAVTKAAQSFYRAGLIKIRERSAIVRAAAQSDCGKKH